MKNDLKDPDKLPRSKAIGTYEMLIALNRRKWIFLLLIFLSGASTFWFLRYKLFTYNSTATFYMSEASGSSTDAMKNNIRVPELFQVNDQFNRAYQLITSSVIHEHLIRKFNLLKHYGIDTTQEFYFEKAIATLNSRISVKKSPFNLISVTVSDMHRYLAAELANEIVNFLDLYNKQLLIQSMQQRISLYDALLKNLQSDNSIRSSEFNRQMAELNLLINKMDKRSSDSPGLHELQSNLNQLIFSIQKNTEDLTQLKVTQALALQSIHENYLPSLVTVQKARPSHQSSGWRALIIGSIVSLSVLSLLVYYTYIQLRYKNYFRVLISNHKPEPQIVAQQNS